MLIQHNRRSPVVHETAWVAPGAIISGDVTIGPECRILPGAVVAAEEESVRIGRCCIILENAVVRSTRGHPVGIGDHCLVGPTAHLAGCTLEDEVFVATGASIFHGANIGRGSEVRVNGVVHVRTQLPAGSTVPISWVAVGRPASVLPPDQHDRIWAIQEPLGFPQTVYGLERTEATMTAITRRLSERLASHREDSVIDGDSG